MKKSLKNRNSLLIGALLIIFLVFLILPRYSNFLYGISITPKVLTVEQLAIESVRVRYIGGDKNMIDKIFTPDFIKKLDEDEMSFFYTNKIFYDIDKSSLKNGANLNPKTNIMDVRVYDSSGGYFQVLTLEKGADGNYLISNIQIDI